MFGHWSAAISASRKNPAPKCGMITGTVGKREATARERERIAEPQIERRRQAELLADADGQHAAVHEHRRAVSAAAANTSLHPLIVQAIAVHRGKQADAAQSAVRRARARAGAATSPAAGLNMKKPTKRERMAAGPRRDRLLVAGNARDERGARDAVPIELGDPAIGQLGGAAGILPAKAMRYCGRPLVSGQVRHARGQQLEKPGREEMAMRVAQSHDEKAIIIGLVSDTHGMVRDGLFEALAGVSQILHAGDVGGRSMLDALATIAPVQAVCGNVDPIDRQTTPTQLALDCRRPLDSREPRT